MNRIFIALMILLVWTGCTSSQDLLVGKWQVAVVERGGEVIGGPRFNGTVFEFRTDGVVRTMGVDTSEVNYRREGTSLIYEQGELTETYRIDSLTEEVLIIFSEADEIPTQTTFIRLEE